MPRFLKDEGIVLKRVKLRDNSKLVTVFSRNVGKLSLFAFGARTITSRRISHLQTGNLISYVAVRRGEYVSLTETEIVCGYPRVRCIDYKTNLMFLAFLVLDKILPEAVHEPRIFKSTMAFLDRLNVLDDRQKNFVLLDRFLKGMLVTAGFAAQDQVEEHSFDPVAFVEEILNRRLKRLIL